MTQHYTPGLIWVGKESQSGAQISVSDVRGDVVLWLDKQVGHAQRASEVAVGFCGAQGMKARGTCVSGAQIGARRSLARSLSDTVTLCQQIHAAVYKGGGGEAGGRLFLDPCAPLELTCTGWPGACNADAHACVEYGRVFANVARLQALAATAFIKDGVKRECSFFKLGQVRPGMRAAAGRACVRQPSACALWLRVPTDSMPWHDVVGWGGGGWRLPPAVKGTTPAGSARPACQQRSPSEPACLHTHACMRGCMQMLDQVDLFVLNWLRPRQPELAHLHMRSDAMFAIYPGKVTDLSIQGAAPAPLRRRRASVQAAPWLCLQLAS